MKSFLTINQLKSRIQQLENLIKKFPTVRSLVRKWGFELTVLEGQLEATEKPKINKITWTIEAYTRRQEGNLWLAQLTGQDSRYTFARKFLEPSDIRWGKRGMDRAQYQIIEPGFYQDVEGDFFQVFVNDKGELDYRDCCYAEVKHHFYHAKKA